jgi:hypothetical protein
MKKSIESLMIDGGDSSRLVIVTLLL